jgi:hypothetical protein
MKAILIPRSVQESNKVDREFRLADQNNVIRRGIRAVWMWMPLHRKEDPLSVLGEVQRELKNLLSPNKPEGTTYQDLRFRIMYVRPFSTDLVLFNIPHTKL